MNLNVKVNIDTAAIKERIMKSVNDSLPQLAEEVLKDCNYYAPQRYGVLTNSPHIHSDLKPTIAEAKEKYKPTITVNETEHYATIKWEAPYSSRVYKGVSKRGKPLRYSKWPNQNAQKKWCEKAKSIKLKKWNDYLETLMRNHYKDNGGK